jgi:alkylhydroperoxidase family enzyme
MNAFIPPPRRLSWPFRLANGLIRRILKKELLLPSLLAWYPKAAVSSAVLEGLVAHDEPGINERMLKMVRMAVSFMVNCPFCMDMNAFGWEALISPKELSAIQGQIPLSDAPTLTPQECLAIEYARLSSGTPLRFPADFIARLREKFDARQIVILAATAAQVNYWARLIQALGCPPAGFSSEGEK